MYVRKILISFEVLLGIDCNGNQPVHLCSELCSRCQRNMFFLKWFEVCNKKRTILQY